MDLLLSEIQEFLTGVPEAQEPDRVLATIMFVDIVGSTEHATRLGDRQWRDVLDRYYAIARRQLVRFRGREIGTAGDGFIATFDGPARAIRCARTIADEVSILETAVRVGIHSGECEVIGDNLGGIDVHTGARIAGQAGPSEVLVSSTVNELVAVSSNRFEDRGRHPLKGVPGEWSLFAVAADCKQASA